METDTQPERGGFREGVRRQMRDGILDAARELTVGRGWGNVRMADVATTAGVSRRTVYNEFATRDQLAEAMVQRELDVFMDGIREVLVAQGADLRSAVYETVMYALRAAGDNPLVKAALANVSSGDGSLLPYLTTDAGILLRGASRLIEDHAAAHLVDVPPERIRVGADMLARVVVSNIVHPRAPAEEVAAGLADLVEAYIHDIIGTTD
jgi:AcrR family transcriptional regulator